MPTAPHRVRAAGHGVVLLLLLAGLALAWPQALGGRTSYVLVSGDSMDPTMRWGDLAVVRSQDSYRVGDAVAYRVPADDVGAGAVVIHRIVGGDGRVGFQTKGDNRTAVDPWLPRQDDVVGLAVTNVPGAGTWLVRLAQPLPLGLLLGGLSMLGALPSRRTSTADGRGAGGEPVDRGGERAGHRHQHS